MVKLDHLPRDRGRNKKYLSCHHPVIRMPVVGIPDRKKCRFILVAYPATGKGTLISFTNMAWDTKQQILT